MKKTFVLAFAFILMGCTNSTTFEDTDIEISKVEDVTKTEVTTMGLGGTCGGATANHCKAGLECKVDIASTDSSGICVESVVDKNLICPKEQAPVCGKKDGVKNGYMNECEATRHGATVLYEGLCKPDENVVGSCDDVVTGIGNCDAEFSGFEFDKEAGACTKKWISGCDAEVPFESLRDCQKSCITGQEETKVESALLQVCPEEKIINNMPGTVGDTNVNEYFIYQGERKEINEFDPAYLEENCDIETQVVS